MRTAMMFDVHDRTDQVLLRELLQNLLANTLRFTGRDEVTSSCVPCRAGRTMIEVADIGIGIDQAAQPESSEIPPRWALHRNLWARKRADLKA